MAKSATNISIDSVVKQQATELFNELGLDLSTAIGLFLKKSVAVGGIPFELKVERPNEETMEAIREVQLMKKDRSIGRTYTDVDQMMEDLLK